MKSLLLILIAVIFLKRGMPVPERIEVYFPRSYETVLMIRENGIYYEYHDVRRGAYTLYPDGGMVRESQLECEVF